MNYRAISIGEVGIEFRELLQEHRQLVLGGIAGIFVLGFLPSLLGVRTGVAEFVVQVMLQCMVTAQLLGDRNMYAATSKSRSLMGAILLSGIATAFGLVLLIVPGLILMARWFLVTPFVVRDEMKILPAMRASWAATKESQGVFVVLAAIYFGLLTLMIVTGVEAAKLTGLRPDSLYLRVPTSLFSSIVVVGGWVAAAAAFNAMETPPARSRTVFS